MLTMRSTSVTKMVKPPPPVPPRPSKTVVAEALAKRRNMNILEDSNSNTMPVRLAPPPPPVELAKSRSSVSVNFPAKKTYPNYNNNSYDRSISEEIRSNSRTIVFQSSNMKSFKNNNNNNSKNVLVRKESFDNKQIMNVNNNNKTKLKDNAIDDVELEKNEKVIVTTKNILNAPPADVSLNEDRVKITHTQVEDDSSKSLSNCCNSDASSIASSTENILTFIINGDEGTNFNVRKEDPDIPMGNTANDPKEGENFDEKWDDMLKDKNHVNMLIDEMFASVLEVSKNVEANNNINNNKQYTTTYNKTISTTTGVLSTDNTTITINASCDNNKYESFANVETTNGPTVLIIESNNNDVNNKVDTFLNKTSSSMSKIKGSTEKIFAYRDKNNGSCSNASTMEKKSVQFDDKKNAELLIEELECMRMEQEKILKRQRKRSQEIYDFVNNDNDDGCECDNEDEEKVKNCHVFSLRTNERGAAWDYERLKTMSSLHGLPPLPKSLSSFNLNENNCTNPPTPLRTTSIRGHQGLPSSVGSSTNPFITHKGVNGLSEVPVTTTQGRKSTNLDAQLAILKREMYSLRQLDLSLLSQLWSLNESIQDFRQILQEQEDCRGVLSPPSPSPPPSSCDEGDGEEQYYINAPPKITSSAAPSMKFRPAPPPPPPARRSSNSSNASTGC